MAIQLYDLAAADEDRRFSPNCWRVRMALAHKGLAVRTIPWRFTDKAVIAFSGQGAVPVMVDGERTVVDSWCIAVDLEDRYADRPTLFGCEPARQHALFIKHWVERALNPLALRMIALDIFDSLHERDQAYFRRTREARFGMPLEALVSNREQTKENFQEVLAPLRSYLAEQPFLGGAAPLFGDYIVFGVFQWMRCVSEFRVLAKDDLVYAWRERLLDLYGGLARRALAYAV